MTAAGCQRLVVVHGDADPVLASTLVFVGLHVVHRDRALAVWAPLEWGPPWAAPARCEHPELYAHWDDIPMAPAAYPCELSMEDR